MYVQFTPCVLGILERWWKNLIGKYFFNLDNNNLTTIKNIIANFIPCENIICDDRDPTWISNRIKKLIHEWNSPYKEYRKNNDTQIFEKLTLSQKKLDLAMEESKDTCYSNFSTKLIMQISNSTRPNGLSWIVKKYHGSYHYFIKTNSWLILEKKMKFLIFFLQINIH